MAHSHMIVSSILKYLWPVSLLSSSTTVAQTLPDLDDPRSEKVLARANSHSDSGNYLMSYNILYVYEQVCSYTVHL